MFIAFHGGELRDDLPLSAGRFGAPSAASIGLLDLRAIDDVAWITGWRRGAIRGLAERDLAPAAGRGTRPRRSMLSRPRDGDRPARSGAPAGRVGRGALAGRARCRRRARRLAAALVVRRCGARAGRSRGLRAQSRADVRRRGGCADARSQSSRAHPRSAQARSPRAESRSQPVRVTRSRPRWPPSGSARPGCAHGWLPRGEATLTLEDHPVAPCGLNPRPPVGWPSC